MASKNERRDAHVESAIAGVDVEHRMASHEPDDFDRDLGIGD